MIDYEEATARCWAEIDLDVLKQNYRNAVELAQGAQVFCVLKADAYGLGATEVCRALIEAGARVFCVADGDEAEELLEAYPDIDVLVLGCVAEKQICRLILKGCMFTMYSRDYALRLINAAKTVGQPARVHIKAETGLYRLGFTDAESVLECVRAPELKIEGLFTHLALHNRAADMEQFAQLDAMADALRSKGIALPTVHVLDSIGMVRYPEYRHDAVRIGAWLYGVTPHRCPCPEKCGAVVRMHARIAQIHDVPKDRCVGYDDDHPMMRPSRVATLTAGYADGLPRYKARGEVVIRGQRAPVLGVPCMDQMMVDVTDIPDAAAGDTVTFLGEGIGIDTFAEWGAMNHNEALARMSRRIQRIYFENGKVIKILNRIVDGRIRL